MRNSQIIGQNFRLVLFIWLIFLFSQNFASAATINVPGDYTTIQAAINAANNGDDIVVAAAGGPYIENIVFNGSKDRFDTCLKEGSYSKITKWYAVYATK